MKSSAIDEVINKVAKVAESFGISRTELRVYSSLLIYGEMTAREVSDRVGISYTKVYEVLGKVEKRNWIYKTDGKPVRYVAYPLRDVWGNIKKEIELKISEFEKNLIEPLSSILSNSSPVYSIVVLTNIQVEKEIIRLLNSSHGKVMIAFSQSLLPSEDIIKAIYSASQRCEIRALVTSDINLKLSGLSIRTLKSMFGSGIITPDSIILVIKNGDSNIGILSNHRYFVDIGSIYFEYLWQQAVSLGENT